MGKAQRAHADFRGRMMLTIAGDVLFSFTSIARKKMKKVANHHALNGGTWRVNSVTPTENPRGHAALCPPYNLLER